MKHNIFLAILFAIVTTFTALHGVEHIEHNENHDSASCYMCHVNGLESPDVISKPEFIEVIHFEKIKYTSLVFQLNFKIRSNQNRAPPILS